MFETSNDPLKGNTSRIKLTVSENLTKSGEIMLKVQVISRIVLMRKLHLNWVSSWEKDILGPATCTHSHPFGSVSSFVFSGLTQELDLNDIATPSAKTSIEKSKS